MEPLNSQTKPMTTKRKTSLSLDSGIYEEAHGNLLKEGKRKHISALVDERLDLWNKEQKAKRREARKGGKK